MKLRNQVLISDIKSVGSLSFVCNTTNSILFALRLLVQTNNLEDYEIYNDVFVKKTSYKVTQADYDRFNLVNNEKIGDTVILTLINHKCPNCGSNILDNTKKCPYCDTKFY